MRRALRRARAGATTLGTQAERRLLAPRFRMAWGDPLVGLTFDDGPDPYWTPRLLDLLAEAGATATFFVVGWRVRSYPELVRRMVAEGHAVGSHTETHPYMWTVGPAEARQEVERGHEALETAVGGAVDAFRAPHDAITLPLALAVRARGLVAWNHTLDPRDWHAEATAGSIVDACDLLAAGDVVLLHDGMESPHDPRAVDRGATLAAVPELVARARRRGLRATGVTVQRLAPPAPASTPAPAPVAFARSCTVVIPSHLRREALRRLLVRLDEDVRRTPGLGDGLDVVVALDGTGDASAAGVRLLDLALDLRVLELPVGGRARTRNAGLAAARGDVVVLLDDDVVPRPGALVAHRRAHESGAPRIVLGPSPIPAGWPAPAGVRAWWDAQTRRVVAAGRVDDVADFATANVSAPRALLAGLGDFDDGFRGYGGEDTELAERARAAGVEIAVEPAAAVDHLLFRTPAEAVRSARSEGRNAVRLVAAHPDARGLLPQPDPAVARLVGDSPARLAQLARLAARVSEAEGRLLGSERTAARAARLQALAGVGDADPELLRALLRDAGG